jgi:acetolactate synthase-1/2/3 large subunit
VRSLANAGVRRLFTLSGNHVMPVFDAAIDAGVALIHTRHEAAAVHMADAWARLSGEPGVALVTGGPGHANALSALYTARMAEAPVVLLSGEAPAAHRDMGAFQEMRQAEMAAPVTKASWTVAAAADIGPDIARAFRIARSGRPGPVHLGLPIDLVESLVPQASVADAATFAAQAQPLADIDAERVLGRLAAAGRPLILGGPACMAVDGRARMRRLEALLGIPVVGMESPRGVHDPSLGAFAEVLAQADCILLLGKRLDFTLQFGQPPTLAAGCRFLQIDADRAELARTRRAVDVRLALAVVADPVCALDGLARRAQTAAERGRNRVAELPGRAKRAESGGGGSSPCAAPEAGGWIAEVRAAIAYRPSHWDELRASEPGRLHPVEMCRPLQALIDSDPRTVLVCDGGEVGQWAQACLTARRRIINGVAGSIGSGVPFALAARLACPEAPVVAVMGDGAFGFHLAEFDTAMRYSLPFVVAIGNDERWNAEYQIQLERYGPDRLIGCELRPMHYDAVARGFGGYGERVADGRRMAGALRRALGSALPACIDVQIEGAPAPKVRRGG